MKNNAKNNREIIRVGSNVHAQMWCHVCKKGVRTGDIVFYVFDWESR